MNKDSENIPEYFLDLRIKDGDLLDLWVLSYLEGKSIERPNDKIFPAPFIRWAKDRYKPATMKDLFDFSSAGKELKKEWLEKIKEYYQVIHEHQPSSLSIALQHSLKLYQLYPQIQEKVSAFNLLELWSYFAQVFCTAMSPGTRKHVEKEYMEIVNKRRHHAKENLEKGKTHHHNSSSFNCSLPDRSISAKRLRLKQVQEQSVKEYKQLMGESKTELPPVTADAKPLAPPFDLSKYRERSDENGRDFWIDDSSIPIKISYASHIGPEHAQKLENQDAVFVKLLESGFVFALADGVSTSMGARIAALIAVNDFCQYIEEMAQEYKSGFSPTGLLKNAARHVYQRLNVLLNDFLVKAKESGFKNDPVFKEIMGKLQPQVAIRLCQNTRDPQRRHWGPVFSTTLIGGIVRKLPDSHDKYEMTVLCIGDGILEHYRNSQESVISLFKIDPDEMAITSSLCPGPSGELSIEKVKFTGPFELSPGDSILFSSDGLGRGHNTTVWEKLKEIYENKEFNELSAVKILRQAIDYADYRYNNGSEVGQEKLFGDNLSLILITLKERG